MPLFFISGVSALIYEIVWSRQLAYYFGATFFAISAVVAAFMGGLALGSWLGGRYVDRNRNPLRVYGFLEIFIGLSALALPPTIDATYPLYKWLEELYPASFMAFSLLRFVRIFIILMVPTTLMGATLPVLSRFYETERRRIGEGTGTLYAANTVGAVLGCFWAGFFGIAYMGLTGSMGVAVMLNLLCGLAALGLSYKFRTGGGKPVEVPTETEREMSGYSRATSRALLAVYGITGMTALGYQVIWSRALVFSFDYYNRNSTYAFTAILTVFLIGLSAGSAIMSRLLKRIESPLRAFSIIQLAIGLTAALSLYLMVYVAPHLTLINPVDSKTLSVTWAIDMTNIFARTATVVLPCTVLLGMAFPLAVKLCVPDLRKVGYGTGKVYAFNTIGAVLGAVIPGFVLIPLMGIAKTLIAFAVVNVISAFALSVISRHTEPGARRGLVAVGAAMSAFLLILIPQDIKFVRSDENSKLIYYEEGPLANITVLEDSNGFRAVSVDGIRVAGTNLVMQTDQKTLAHLPMLLMRETKTALAFGFGSGGTAYSFLRHSGLERLDVVELSPTIIKTAPLFEASNHGVLKEPRDPRLNIIIDDARNYLRANNVLYDIIEIDCTDLSYKASASLYALEYFQLCRRHLSEKGAVVVWMPLKQLSDGAFRSVLKTFSGVFPYVQAWYFNNESTHYIVLLGTASELKIDYELFLQRMDDPNVRQDLAEVNLNDPFKFLSCFVTDQEYIRRISEGARLNTEDYPYVEFHAFRVKYAAGMEKMWLDNLNLILGGRKDIYRYLAHVPDGEVGKVRAKLQRYTDALPLIMAGHNYKVGKNLQTACQSYKMAYEINPDDSSVLFFMLHCRQMGYAN